MSTTESEYILVRLEPGLHHSRVTGIWHAIANIPGVKCEFSLDLMGLSADRMDVLTGRPASAREAPAS